MDFAESVNELQRIADYRKGRQTLRIAGRAALIFGLFAVLEAALSTGLIGALQGQGRFRLDLWNTLFLLVGIALLVDGILNTLVPTAAGIIVDGVVFLVVGVWNSFVTVMNFDVGRNPQVIMWGLIGVAQIGWSIARFVTYPKYRRYLERNPTTEDLQRMDELVKSINNTKTKHTDDFISFQYKGPFRQPHWKGQLARNAAIFVNENGDDVLVAFKENVHIDVYGKTLLGKSLKATIKIRDRQMKALISPTSYERYQAWKADMEPGNEAQNEIPEHKDTENTIE